MIHGDSVQLLLCGELDQFTFAGVLADPPYSSGGMFRGDRALGTVDKYVQNGFRESRAEFDGDTRDQLGYLSWSTLWMSAARRLCDPGAVMTCWCDWRQLPVSVSAVQSAGWVWRNIGTWCKSNGRMVRGRLGSNAEHVTYCSNGPTGGGELSARSWFRAPVVAGKARRHICEKPVATMLWLLAVMPSGVVLDPFAGSGSCSVACKLAGRRSVAVESMEENCEVIADRLEAAEPLPADVVADVVRGG